MFDIPSPDPLPGETGCGAHAAVFELLQTATQIIAERSDYQAAIVAMAFASLEIAEDWLIHCRRCRGLTPDKCRFPDPSPQALLGMPGVDAE